MRQLKYWVDVYFDQLYADWLDYPYKSPKFEASGGLPPGSKPPPGAERYRPVREFSALKVALERLSEPDRALITIEHAPVTRTLTCEVRAKILDLSVDQFRYRRKLVYRKLLQALPSFANL